MQLLVDGCIDSVDVLLHVCPAENFVFASAALGRGGDARKRGQQQQSSARIVVRVCDARQAKDLTHSLDHPGLHCIFEPPQLQLLLVHVLDGLVLDVARLASVVESRMSLALVALGWGDAGEEGCLRVAAERILEQVCEFAVAVGNVLRLEALFQALVVSECVDDLAQIEEPRINLDALHDGDLWKEKLQRRVRVGNEK